MRDNFMHSEKTEIIIRCFYKVYNTLGYGFLEKVYENAFYYELTQNGLQVERQKPIKVIYEGIVIGDFIADLMVDGIIIIELKAIESLSTQHECQIVNYIKATNTDVGLLLNFGKKPEIKRKVLNYQSEKTKD